MPPIDWWVVVALVGAAFTAGWVDAVVGGGGLIQLPALLLGLPAGIGTATVSGTNKISSVAGTAMATGTYLRSVKLHWPTAATLVPAAAIGSALGARLVHFLPRAYFTPLVLVACVVVGVYTYRRPHFGLVTHQRAWGRGRLPVVGAIGLGMGAYDGFIGPGTGAFLIILIVAVLGYGFLEASAYAKLANLTTNLAAISVFAVNGQVLWLLGGMMAGANLTGGLVGARLAVRHGNSFIRKVFLIVVAGLSIKLAWDTGAMLVAL